MKGITQWMVPPDHPAFAGHFPGTPILPGVVLLDAVLQAIAAATGIELDTCEIGAVKFLHPVGPGDRLEIRCEIATGDAIRFDIATGEHKIASGSIVPRLRA